MSAGTGGNVVPISRLAGKDRQRFLLQIVNEHETAIKRFLRLRLANEADRDDIVQEVFMRLCRMENLADKLSLGAERTRAFLFMTAANLIRDLHRRETSRHRSAHEPFDDDSLADQTALIEDRLQSREKLEIVRQAIEGLKPPCRQAFEMSRFECMSYREIADQMGVTVSMVEKHITNALIVVRDAVDGGELSGNGNSDGAGHGK